MFEPFASRAGSRRRRTMLSGLLCLGGCGGQAAHHSAPPEAAPRQVAVVTRESAGICPQDGVFDFSVRGSELGAFEGRRVWAVAVERPDRERPKRVVRLQGMIRDGRFALECRRSLRETYAYPSWAVVIDADGDGACSAADKQTTEQLYGWNFDMRLDVTNTANGEVATWEATVAQAQSSVGNREAFDFCEFYFR